MKIKNKTNNEIAISLFAAFLVLIVIVKCAWICDDAYISFKYIKNFLNGHGLEWNIGERVQAFSNPLYILGLTPIYAITKNMYLSAIFYSVMLTMFALYIAFFHKGRRNAYVLLICISLLVGAKSFIDYSTSGLENPMTFLLLSVFYRLFFMSDEPYDAKQFLKLCIISSLALLNRMDSILLFVPALCYCFFRHFSVKKILYGFLGFLPFIVWELFSVFYYGVFIPNTAIAKLNIMTEKISMIKNGIYYLKATFLYGDYFTLPVIVITIITSLIFIKKNMKYFLATIGGVLYVCYIVYIGGDFMVGRHLSSVYFLSIIIIFNICYELYNVKKYKLSAMIAFASIIILGMISYTSPIKAAIAYDQNVNSIIVKNEVGTVTDERQFYYYDAGLGYYFVNTVETGYQSERPLTNWGKDAPQEKGVYLLGRIGFSGYFGSEYAYIIDKYALSDALLSRIPAAPNQRVGHYERLIPEGYSQTVISGENKIQNEYLSEYYEKLKNIISGDIWSADRFKTIFKMNTGQYDYLIENYMKSNEYTDYLIYWENLSP